MGYLEFGLSGKSTFWNIDESSVITQPVLEQGERMKKSYERPEILHTEKLEARAVACSKAEETTCGAGPVQS